MTRNALVSAILAVAGTCLLAATPAGAAATGSRAGQSVTAPSTRLGTHCTTVQSRLHTRVGVICISVISLAGGNQHAEVTFRARSGTLRQVSAGNLAYLVRSRIVEMTGRAQKLVTGMTASLISRNWCCGRPHRGYSAQSGVFNACMSWRGGGTACTGRRWFYSLVVRFFF